MKYIIPAIAALMLLSSSASAQGTNPSSPNGYAPNMYNRGGQPLSPYLNLLRGGNNAVNYFYGVRPGTQTGPYAGMFNQANTGPRLTFFPGADTMSDLLDDPRDATKVAPTGHAATFSNTLNYFGPTSGQYFSKSQQPQHRR
jgi:hypothetical protein